MAGILQHLRSSTLDKRPNPASMVDGQVAINYASGAPGMFFKNSNGDLVKVGPVHVGSSAPNASPASGGTAGNSIGEQWLDNSGGTYVFKIWDGSAWRSEAGEFVNTTGDTMTGALILPSGTAAAPALGVGSTDNGIYSPGTDQVAISTNGTGRLFVDANGNVKIGGTSSIDTDGLSIETTATAGGLNIISPDNGRGDIFFGDASDKNIGQIRYSHVNDSFTIRTNASDRFVIDSSGTVNIVGAGTAGTTQAVSFNGSAPVNSLVVNSTGNVGIGNGNPINLLDVEGVTPILRVLANGNTASTINLHSRAGATTVGLADIQCSNVGNLLFSTGTTSTTERLRITSAGQLSFIGAGSSGSPAVGFNGSAPSNSLVIDSTGRLGIGTSTVGAQLEVLRTSVTDPAFRLRYNATSYYGDHLMDGNGNYVIYSPPTNGVTSGKLSLRAGANFSVSTNDDPVTSAGFNIDTSGNVGIGTTSPAAQLNVSQSTGSSIVKLNGLNGYDLLISNTQASGAEYNFNIGSGAGAFSFSTSAGERFRCDGSGRLLVGTSTARSNFYNGASTTQFQIEGTTYQNSSQTLICNNATSSDTAILGFAKSAGSTVGSNTLVASGDKLGELIFQGNDGTEFVESAKITAEVDGTPGANDMPGRLVFSTTADGASSPTERMRITNTGETSLVAVNNAFASASTQSAGTSYAVFTGWHSATAGTAFSGTISCYIWNNGNIQNTNNSYGAISDSKLKENIVDANSQWDDIKALQVRNYNFKEGQTHTQIGLVAQEVELVCPGLVSESPDRDEDGNDLGTVTKSVNYSVLYMKAVKALQEAMERIETLEQRLNDAGIN